MIGFRTTKELMIEDLERKIELYFGAPPPVPLNSPGAWSKNLARLSKIELSINAGLITEPVNARYLQRYHDDYSIAEAGVAPKCDLQKSVHYVLRCQYEKRFRDATYLGDDTPEEDEFYTAEINRHGFPERTVEAWKEYWED